MCVQRKICDLKNGGNDQAARKWKMENGMAWHGMACEYSYEILSFHDLFQPNPKLPNQYPSPTSLSHVSFDGVGHYLPSLPSPTNN